MARPILCRRIAAEPGSVIFKPAGVPACELEEITLRLDEFEAIRLSDLECLYQEVAAARMNISRATFGRIIESARRKVALALVEGKALLIQGGNINMVPMTQFKCSNCGQEWNLPPDGGRSSQCPACKSGRILGSACDSGPHRHGRCAAAKEERTKKTS